MAIKCSFFHRKNLREFINLGNKNKVNGSVILVFKRVQLENIRQRPFRPLE